MAYEIDHRPEAEYRLYQFEGDNAVLDRLNQRLRILDAVLRFRIIKASRASPSHRRPSRGRSPPRGPRGAGHQGRRPRGS